VILLFHPSGSLSIVKEEDSIKPLFLTPSETLFLLEQLRKEFSKDPKQLLMQSQPRVEQYQEDGAPHPT
jgi:hypothetical protein